MARKPRPVPFGPIMQPDTLKHASTTYRGVARQSDRLLAKAEKAIKTAAAMWGDIDSGIETELENLGQEVLRARNGAIGSVNDLYGDRLDESAI